MSPHTLRTAWLSASLLVGLAALSGCEKTATDELVQAKASIAAKDNAAAMVHLKSVIAKDPKLGEARLLLGNQLMAAGDAPGAVVEFQRALDLKVPDQEVAPLIANALLASGQSVRLVTLYGSRDWSTTAIAAPMATAMATAYLAQNDLASAKASIQRALTADARSASARLVQARIVLTDGNTVGALKLTDALLADAPTNDEAWSLKAELLQRLPNNQDAAMEAYARALAINPKQFHALSSLTALHLLRNDLSKASELLATMKRIAPKAFYTLYYDARITHLNGHYEAARALFQTALNQSPDNPTALLASGVNELNLKAYLQAETQLNRAMTLMPSSIATRYYLALTQLRLGRPDQASNALAPLLNAEAPAAEVLLAGAQARLMQGDPKGSDALFTRAAKLHARNPNVRVALAVSTAAKGNTDAAVAELQNIAQTSDGTEADMRLISAHIARNELEPALAAIDVLARKQPENPAALELRGQVLLQKKDLAGARAAFEAALQKDPKYLPAVANLAELDLAANQPELAKKRLTDLIAKDPKNVNLLLGMAALAGRTGGTAAEITQLVEKATQANPSDARARLLLIERHFNGGNVQAALAAAQSAVAAIPGNAQLLDAQARCQVQLGDSSQALATYGKIQRLAPKEPGGYLGQAMILFKMNDFDGAAKSLAQLLAVQPKSIEAKRMLIAVALKRKEVDKALTIARELQTEYADQSFGWAQEGEVQLDQGHWAAAATAFRSGLVKQRGEGLAPRLHTALLKDGKTTEADKFSALWLKDHPADIAFLGYLADTAHLANNADEARKRFEQVLALEPKNAGALNNLAWLLVQNKLPGAVAIAERAAAEVPDNPDVLETLGQAYAAERQFPRAIETLKRAISRSGNPATLQFALAKVYLQADDLDKAMAELVHLKEMGKDFPQQAEVRRLIAAQRRN